MRSVLASLVALALALGTARAEQPWDHGVSQDKRDQAQALFAEGNTLFAQQAHHAALEKYNAAVALWDHPLIRFNMAVTQIRLDRIVDAADELDAALRFGAAPFSPDLYRQARDYQKLVGGRVGMIEASCEQPGAQLVLDGKPWFSCPGSKKLRVLAGEHVIVGDKQGFLTHSRRLIVAGNSTARERVTLVPLDDVVKLEYPSPRWMPWTTAGIGAAIALGGVGLWLAGRDQMDQFDADYAIACPKGCMVDLSDQPQLARDHESAQLKGTLGVVTMAAGGALMVSGIAWTIMNRPRRVLPSMELQPATGGASVRIGWRW